MKQLHTMNELVVQSDFGWGLEPVCCWLLLVAASLFLLSLLSSLLLSHLPSYLSSLSPLLC